MRAIVTGPSIWSQICLVGFSQFDMWMGKKRGLF